MSDASDRTIVEAMRLSRDSTLDACIELCEEFARTGHNAACCVKALRDLKEVLPAPPSKQQ